MVQGPCPCDGLVPGHISGPDSGLPKMDVIVRGPPLCDKDCSVILVEFVFVSLFNTFYFCTRFINKDHARTWQKRKHSHLNPAAE